MSNKDDVLYDDIFGNPVYSNPLLRDKFIEPPFSVLDTKSGSWQNRKRQWKALGIRGEVGRTATTFNMHTKNTDNYYKCTLSDTSIFDPALCEVLYRWFVTDGGNILDPFAGGSVRGIVAHYLGYNYTGIDIRQEQIDSNREQAAEILEVNNQPQWYVGDADIELGCEWRNRFDFIFSCPPYGNLEKYSDLPGDISNMDYDKFLIAYERIIKKSCKPLKPGGYACFVVGEIRDKQGNYIGFVPDTIRAFHNVGMKYYNEAILLNSINTARLRAGGNMKSNKLVKVHQNVLIFRKEMK